MGLLEWMFGEDPPTPTRRPTVVRENEASTAGMKRLRRLRKRCPQLSSHLVESAAGLTPTSPLTQIAQCMASAIQWMDSEQGLAAETTLEASAFWQRESESLEERLGRATMQAARQRLWTRKVEKRLSEEQAAAATLVERTRHYQFELSRLHEDVGRALSGLAYERQAEQLAYPLAELLRSGLPSDCVDRRLHAATMQMPAEGLAKESEDADADS